MQLHDLDASYAEARAQQDFRAIQARPLHAHHSDQQHGDRPLAQSLHALFALFGDQPNGEAPKI